ncbi:ArsR/SmtB family transcription factor [Clostridium sp. FP1]|uniref:ArsR/SmtB family transcription factor n=1 Tax=Clostridium sp. FP1 TaxID=2724076 RepID=UPI0013E997CB|nr:metalloregulator ArsR/SmtB family transcription factor [Clostridium sp. FP1]MBZ9633408.1 metalloregulator ArsR/SmtB family transcription factor [Clostridium sp. FP1]
MEKDKSLEVTLQKFKDCIPLFDVLADEHRQRIIMILAKEKEGLNVNLITEKMILSRPAVSHHLKVLKQVRIIDVRKEGTENIYYLTLKPAIEKIKHFLSSIENTCGL